MKSYIKQDLVVTFRQASDELIELLSSCNGDQINQIIVEGKWTVGQVGDHVFRSYAVVNTLNGNTKISMRPVDEKVGVIKDLFLNFNIKFDSPKSVLPTSQKIIKSKLLAGLHERIAALLKVLATKDLSEICTDFAIPEYGEFTRLEWMWFNTFHTQRHNWQIKNLIAEMDA